MWTMQEKNSGPKHAEFYQNEFQKVEKNKNGG
jgi:hypothetical protein